MITVKKLFALTLWLLIFPSLANAVQYNSYNLLVAWEDNVPGKLKAIFSINEAVTFNILDAEIGWDSAVLTPNEAAFFEPGALLANFTVDPTEIMKKPLDQPLPTSPLTFYAIGYPTYKSTQPGELFSMLFDINSGLSVPVTTSLSVLLGDLDEGLVLTYSDPSDPNNEKRYVHPNFDPNNPLYDPNTLPPSFSQEVQPTASAPTPGVLAMLFIGLVGLVRQQSKSNH